jgi:hypothetical protein
LLGSEEFVLLLFLSAADIGSVKQINNVAVMTDVQYRISKYFLVVKT